MFIISPVKVKSGNREMPDADGQTDEILHDMSVEQRFTNSTEDITEVAVVFNRAYYLYDEAEIVVELLDGNKVLAQNVINADDVPGDHRTYINIDNPISGMVGKVLTLKIYTTSTAGTGLSLMMNSKANESFLFGDKKINGTICFSITGK